MPVELAPIGMSVYTRIEHFKQSISALQANALADRSDLFIFSDAASTPEDEDRVQEVREFARNIRGFRRVCLTARDVNYGGTRNSFQAYAEIIDRFGASIYVEDDIVCAPGFLTFMNEALEFYQDDKRVVSIAGYRPPFSLPRDFQDDVFAVGRINGWGMGSFERTLEMARKMISREEFDRVVDKSVFAVNGRDVLRMITMELEGLTDAGDVRSMYHQVLANTLTVYPRSSLTRNIGMDGTGVHSGATTKFHVENLWNKTEGFEFQHDIAIDGRIQKAHCKFWDDSLIRRVRRKLAALLS